LQSRAQQALSRFVAVLAGSALSLVVCCDARAQTTGVWTHAFAEYGEPKYAAGFDHYDFVNPDAPKGGVLSVSNPDRRTSYDKFNMFTLPNSSPAGVELFVFEPLCDPGADELATMYGLVAQEILVAPDFSAVSFRVDPRARFNNGDPVTATDVKYSFDMETSDKSGPFYAQFFDDVKSATIVDARTVRFDLKEPSRDQIYRLGTKLEIFSTKWGLGPDGKPLPFDQIVHQEPITTGAYRIHKAAARTLDLELRPDYWARDIGVRRGYYNFSHIVYHYYIDNAARFEAFKAGDFDILRELRPRRWMRLYNGPKFTDGRIKKERFADGMGFFYEGFLLNLRRPQFQDRRVREAINYTFDWGWSSAQGFNMDGRFDGLFQNSVFSATDTPSPGELKLLEPYRGILQPSAFGVLPKNPRSATPADLRANLLHARELLAEAGWTIAADGRLRNQQGTAFEMEFLDADLEFAPIVGRWAGNLEKLGITVNQRLVDFAIYQKRQDAFDFDVSLVNLGDMMLPSASYLTTYLGSAAAKVEGSNNLQGLANPAIDHALEAMAKAPTLNDVIDATRAADRVFVSEYYAVPYIFRPFHMVAYWNRLGRPATFPKYYSVEDGIDAMPWPIATWWIAEPS
jgi:microcin C transport system substrate-binding protein